MRTLPDSTFPLIYIDPPFNTGRIQQRTSLQTVRSENGARVGFQGRRYDTTVIGRQAFADAFDDYLAFLEPRLVEAHRVLAANGTLYFHIDYREAHYCKVLLDAIFGRACFLNEIIWAYDYGARTKKRWPAKHDTIFVYVKNPNDYVFNSEDVDREPYMAPGLVGPEKAARGKLPTDCFSDDTDILTDQGWISFSDLTLSHRVATVSPTGILTYEHPSQLHAYFYKGEMCAFKSKTVDILVTPNHQLYVRAKHRDAYGFVRADRLIEQGRMAGEHWHVALINRLTWDVEEAPAHIVLPNCEYARPHLGKRLPGFDLGDWCEFLGLYLSEGSTSVYADRYEVAISQQKQENLGPINQLLERMGLTYHYNGRTFVICNKQMAEYLRPLGKAHEKYVPNELLGLPRWYLERLYHGLMMGDGYRRRNEELYSTTSRQLADDMQEIMIKLGYNASITLGQRDAEAHPRWHPIYRVRRRTSQESFLFPIRHGRKIDYEGMVYCCTVEPHHTLVVRRNGKPLVCGNCWWHTIVSPTGKEKTGYPTQKPLGVLRRIIRASSNPDDVVLDFFAGSGTTGVAALELGRGFLLVDSHAEALATMARRFTAHPEVEFVGFDPAPHRDTAQTRLI